MIAALKAFADRFLGRGDATITVPSFDGALKPNQILEKRRDDRTSSTRPRISQPTARRSTSPTAWRSCGSTALRHTEVRRFDRAITALCCLPDGGIAVALDGREVQVFATPSASVGQRDVFRSVDQRDQRAVAGTVGNA